MTVPRGTPPGVEQSAALQEDQLRRIAALERASTSGSGGSVVIPDPLLLADGSAAAPSLAFTADTDTGMYRAGTNEIGFTAGGVELLSVGSADVDVMTGHLNLISNTGAQTMSLGEWSSGFNYAAVETPSMVVLMGNASDVNSQGFMRTKGTGSLNLGVNNSNDLTIADGGAVSTVGDITAGGDIVTAVGSAAAPSHTFTGFTTTGMYQQGTNEVGFATAGTENLRLTGSNLRMASATSVIYNTGYFRGVAATGTAASPTYSWDGDSNTGMYRVAADVIGFATAGAALFRMDSSVLRGNVNYTPSMPGKTAGSAAAPAYSFVNDTDTGMYRSGTNQIAFSCGNATRLTIASTGEITGTKVQATGSAPGSSVLLKSHTNDYTYLGWLNTVSGSNTATPSRIYTNNGGTDSFVRYMTLENFRISVADQTKFCSPPTRVFNYSGNRTVNTQYSRTFPATIGGVSLSGAKAIIVNLAVRSAGNAYFVAWKYGETLPGIALVNLVPNVFGNVQATIPMDSSRRIRYMYGATAGNYTIFDVIGVVF